MMGTTLLLLRLVFALAAVLALLWIAAKLLSRSSLGQKNQAGKLQVVSRASLTRSASVALVQLGDQAILLGVTDQQVNVLHSTHAAQVIEPTELAELGHIPAQRVPIATSGSVGTLMQQLRARTERR